MGMRAHNLAVHPFGLLVEPLHVHPGVALGLLGQRSPECRAALARLVNTGQLGVFAIGVSAFCVVILVAAGGSAGLDGSVKSSWASCSIGQQHLKFVRGRLVVQG